MNNGLSSKRAQELIKIHGFNEIKVESKKSLIKVFFSQFKDIFAILLFISALLALSLSFFGVGESYIDFALIMGILLINGVIGTYQEYKVEKTLDKLKNMQRTISSVYRDNRLVKLDSKYIVPTDLILLEEGDKIIADCILSEGNLTVDESSFTGESFPVTKKTGDIVHSGTFVKGGSAKLIVQKTGTHTRFGQLTEKVANIEDVSFFKNQLDDFSSKLIRYIVVIIIIFFASNFINSNDYVTILLATVALGVSLVPQSMLVATILTMINGINKMSEKNVLVRKKDSIQVLGSTNYLLFDKTGTLTEGKIKLKSYTIDKSDLSKYALVNSKDTIDQLLKYKPIPNAKIKHINVFDYKTRTSSIIYEIDGKEVEYLKGAPESVFEICSKSIDLEEYLKEGYRVLAVAKREDNKWNLEGLLVFEDPIREDAKKALELMKKASIMPVLVTGDHKETARHVSEILGMPKIYLSGDELSSMSLNEAYEHLKDGGVVYRAVPETKFRLVEVYQSQSKVVGATGDGVNDVLLLKKADVGISMGVRGTDIAKESSDIILLDDSLLSIVSGIIQGRGIILNVRKFITYLLTTNVIEAISNLVFPFMHNKLPLDAPKLLWMNLVTDGLPALAFGLDSVSDNVINKKPEDFKFLLTKRITKTFVYSGLIASVVLILAFYFSLMWFGFLIASTITLTVLVFSELGKVYIIRYLFDEKIFASKYMIYALSISAILQIIMMYTPLNKMFKLVPLFGLPLLFTLFCVGIIFVLSFPVIHLIKVKYPD